MGGRLAGKVAFVTGAGSGGPGWGNGKAAAALFAREGAAVIAVDINRAAAEETCSVIAQDGGTAYALAADVTDHASITAAMDEAEALHGGIDILHNNVGTLALGGVVEATLESWNRVMTLNVTSAFLTCKAAIPRMIARGGGAIVNISSIVAITNVGPHYISYSASKAALNQFTRAVAIEHAGAGIRCNAIMPGLMRTPMVEATLGKGLSPAELDALIARRDAACPMGRMGGAWDVAEAALFLASDAARYITGQIIAVDGGVSLRSPSF